jgi:hypothetical protein
MKNIDNKEFLFVGQASGSVFIKEIGELVNSIVSYTDDVKERVARDMDISVDKIEVITKQVIPTGKKVLPPKDEDNKVEEITLSTDEYVILVDVYKISD